MGNLVIQNCNDTTDNIAMKEREIDQLISEKADLDRQLRHNKKMLNEIMKEQRLLAITESPSSLSSLPSRHLARTSVSALTVDSGGSTTDDSEVLRTDIINYKNRITDLESRLKLDKHQITSLQTRLDQISNGKIIAEKALITSDTQADIWKLQVDELNSQLTEQRAYTNELESRVAYLESICGNVTHELPPLFTSLLEDEVVHGIDGIITVNNFLKELNENIEFKEKLKLPTVQLAFRYWSGEGIEDDIESEKAEEITNCEAVQSIYPTLNIFDKICKEVHIKIPLDHIEQGKTELDDVTLINSFGEEFCRRHQLLK